MSHPLAGVVEKLRNADYHIQRLEVETRLYLDGGPNAAVLSERDTDGGGKGRLRFKVLHQPPLKIAAIAGDAVHNLRSSLDYVIEELVKKDGGTPTLQHQFPLCRNPDDFAAAMEKGRVRGICKRGLYAIEGFQPYQVKAEARVRHPLTHLRKLSNRDKHHMLAVSALNAQFVWKMVSRDGRILRADQTTEPVEDGGLLAELPLDFLIEGEKAQLQSQIGISVGFPETAFYGFDVQAVLFRIRELIADFMLPAFALLFAPLPDDLKLTPSDQLARPVSQIEMALIERQNPE